MLQGNGFRFEAETSGHHARGVFKPAAIGLTPIRTEALFNSLVIIKKHSGEKTGEHWTHLIRKPSFPISSMTHTVPLMVSSKISKKQRILYYFSDLCKADVFAPGVACIPEEFMVRDSYVIFRNVIIIPILRN